MIINIEQRKAEQEAIRLANRTPEEILVDKAIEEREWRDSELFRTDRLISIPDFPNTNLLKSYRYALRNYPNQVDFPNGARPVFNLTTKDGRSIKTTANHPYLVKDREDVLDYSLRNFNNLPVEIISTSGCALNDFSSDQMPQLNANANAKYWMSFLCGLNFSDCSVNLLKSSNGIVLTCSLISEKSSESSSLLNLLLFNMSSKCFPNSKNINSGAINSIFLESEFKESTLNTLPLESKQEYNLFVSTTTNIFYLPKDCMNLCDKATSDLSDNSFTSCSVNLDLETICFNLANLSNSGLIMLVITKENLSFDNSLISSSNSLGIDIVTSVIEGDSYSDYLKLSNNQSATWIKVSNLKEGMEIAVPDLDAGIKWVKIKSIEDAGEEHVYDLAIENTHNFIANDIVAHNTYIYDNLSMENKYIKNLANGTSAQDAVALSQLQEVNNTMSSDFVPYTGSTQNVVLGAYNFSVDTLDFFVNSNTGNIGIGTTSPGAKLDVSASGADGINIGQDTGVAFNSGRLFFSASGGTYAMMNENNVLTFRSGATAGSGSGTTKMVMDSSGNVGIGTTAPLSKLSINGGLHVGGDSDAGDNNLLVDGSATITGTLDPNGAITLPTTGISGAGSGSGLNADLLDGLDSSAFGDATAANQNTILSRIGTSGDAASMSGSLFAGQQYIWDNRAKFGFVGPSAMSAETVATYNHYNAAKYCYDLSAVAAFAMDGDTTTIYTDWRLPTVDEASIFMGTILDNSVIWTISINIYNNNLCRVVISLSSGSWDCIGEGYPWSVRCVR